MKIYGKILCGLLNEENDWDEETGCEMVISKKEEKGDTENTGMKLRMR